MAAMLSHLGANAELRAVNSQVGAPAGDKAMKPFKLVGLILIAGGVLALVYGGFTYTKDSHDVKVGPIEFSMKEKESVNVPVWAGVGAIAVGAFLLLVGGRKG